MKLTEFETEFTKLNLKELKRISDGTQLKMDSLNFPFD